jgi:hypothetical protein
MVSLLSVLVSQSRIQYDNESQGFTELTSQNSINPWNSLSAVRIPPSADMIGPQIGVVVPVSDDFLFGYF